MKTTKLFLFLAVCLSLAGCGQPGPLYLPGTAPPVYVPPKPKTGPEQKIEPSSKPEPEKNK